MPFLFSYVCDLLQRLEDNRLARSGLRTNATIIREWFRGHQAQLYRDDHNSAPLLSALLPEKRSDRVYAIREKKLQIIIGRALGLGRSRIAQLGRWTIPEARTDLAECVEGILKETPNPVASRAVTVEEIDELLHSIASTCRFSSPVVRSSAAESRLADQDLVLGSLFTRLPARDAKWLTRLILKNYEPIVLDLHVVCSGYHPLLPTILKVQDDLTVAGRILDSQKRDRTVTGRNELTDYLKPTLGVKIGRQTWLKGRSIKHCLSMVHGRISCEEKLDGEYCQIHIDLSKGYDCIQIFSKSGKDSTKDRRALHDSIRKSLQLGQPSCPLKHGCILEGELVVYSDKDTKILDFHKIRKHVSRSGSFLGTDQDSQPHPWEHLMIVYYDLLMLDNDSYLGVQHSERSKVLRELITVVPGRSALVERQIIDCSRLSAASDLRRAFAKCITFRKEGLVLKADDPYFDFDTNKRPYRCCAIKLKKGYINRFGDIGDFAVVGARFDAAKARTYNLPRLKWTHFYVGCLENKEEVQRFGKHPRFVVTNVVELNAAQLEAFMSSVNTASVRPEDNTEFSLRIEPGVDNGKRPSIVFSAPPVVDLRCFSFDKDGNTGFWSPRFASVTKVHSDRTYHDTISFQELQEMASKEKEMPPPDDSQELFDWIAELEVAERPDRSQPNLYTVTASTTPSVRSSQAERSSQLEVSSQPQPSPRLAQPSFVHMLPAVMAANSTTGGGAAAVGGQLASPTSSVAKTVTPKSPAPHNQEMTARGQKRPHESSAGDGAQEMSKVPKSFTDQIASTAPPSQNDDQQEAPASVPAAVTGPATGAAFSVPARPASLMTLAAHRPETPSPTLLASFRARERIWALQRAPPKCKYLDTCTLRTYSILLAPDVATSPDVTDDLLTCHGVVKFIRDPTEWLANDAVAASTEDSNPRWGDPNTAANTITSPTTSAAAAFPRTRRHPKKIILVESRLRREATAEFLKSVGAAGLKRADGKREYVPIYDWRVLRELREEERRVSGEGVRRGEMLGFVRDQVWRRFWVGLA